MPLISCPACSRQISVHAEACPQCGHPNLPTEKHLAEKHSGPRCYHCSSAATTRCQCCGVLSCAVHLQPIYVSHGRGGANELRCTSCYSSAMVWKVVGYVIIAIIAAIILLIFVGGVWH
jgi:hypothetical protein